jgi:hypothetical protein
VTTLPGPPLREVPLRPFLLTLLLSACAAPSVSARQDPLVVPDEPSTDETDPDAPVAHAGEDFASAPLTDVFLDGTRSYDPRGLDIVPQWQIVARPPGSRTVMERADDLRPSFFADIAGTYEIALSVRNSEGLADPTPDTVVVHVVPASSVYIQLTWDADVDLDLHLVPSGDPVWGPTDCSWCNDNPEWGDAEDSIDDPTLDWDAIDGWGPETTTIAVPASGKFRAFVDYYGQGGDFRCRDEVCPETVATADVYVDGERVHRISTTLSDTEQLWEMFEVDWPAGTVTNIDHIGLSRIADCQ